MNRLLSLIRSLLTIQRKNSENDQPLSSEEETFVSEVVAAGRRRIGSEVQMHLMADRYLNTAHIILRLKDDPHLTAGIPTISGQAQSKISTSTG